jgi:hypothetical protein
MERDLYAIEVEEVSPEEIDTTPTAPELYP